MAPSFTALLIGLSAWGATAWGAPLASELQQSSSLSLAGPIVWEDPDLTWNVGDLPKIATLGSADDVVYKRDNWPGPSKATVDITGGFLLANDDLVLRFNILDSTGALPNDPAGGDLEKSLHAELWLTNTQTGQTIQLGFSPGNFNDIPPYSYQWMPKPVPTMPKPGIWAEGVTGAGRYQLLVRVPSSLTGLTPATAAMFRICLSVYFRDVYLTDTITRTAEYMMASSPGYHWNRPATFNPVAVEYGGLHRTIIDKGEVNRSASRANITIQAIDLNHGWFTALDRRYLLGTSTFDDDEPQHQAQEAPKYPTIDQVLHGGGLGSGPIVTSGRNLHPIPEEPTIVEWSTGPYPVAQLYAGQTIFGFTFHGTKHGRVVDRLVVGGKNIQGEIASVDPTSRRISFTGKYNLAPITVPLEADAPPFETIETGDLVMAVLWGPPDTAIVRKLSITRKNTAALERERDEARQHATEEVLQSSPSGRYVIVRTEYQDIYQATLLRDLRSKREEKLGESAFISGDFSSDERYLILNIHVMSNLEGCAILDLKNNWARYEIDNAAQEAIRNESHLPLWVRKEPCADHCSVYGYWSKSHSKGQHVLDLKWTSRTYERDGHNFGIELHFRHAMENPAFLLTSQSILRDEEIYRH